MRHDTLDLKAKIDIRQWAGQLTTLKRKTEKEATGPCPVCQGSDRFNVQKERWLCRKCTNGKWQDVFSLAALKWNLDIRKDFPEICKRLGAIELSPGDRTTQGTTPAATPGDPPPDQEWQGRAGLVIEKCYKWLWEPIGEKARAYLAGRGFNEFDLALFWIGYNPADQTIEGHYVPRGILIPHYSVGHLWGVKIRRPSTKPGEKYTSLKGSKQNLFNADSLHGQDIAFCVEGEFDALLLYQLISGRHAVITLGSAAGTVGDRWLPALLPVKRFYIATDNDNRGREAAAKWQKLTGARGRSVAIPQGKDITEYHQVGGNVRAWVEGVIYG